MILYHKGVSFKLNIMSVGKHEATNKKWFAMMFRVKMELTNWFWGSVIQ
jgi:hypothetical protein